MHATMHKHTKIRTHTHSHSHIYTYFHTRTHTRAHTHTLTLSHTLTHAHTCLNFPGAPQPTQQPHPLAHPPSTHQLTHIHLIPLPFLIHKHRYTHTHSRTHINIDTHTLLNIGTHTLSHQLTLSLTHTPQYMAARRHYRSPQRPNRPRHEPTRKHLVMFNPYETAATLCNTLQQSAPPGSIAIHCTTVPPRHELAPIHDETFLSLCVVCV